MIQKYLPIGGMALVSSGEIGTFVKTEDHSQKMREAREMAKWIQVENLERVQGYWECVQCGQRAYLKENISHGIECMVGKAEKFLEENPE